MKNTVDKALARALVAIMAAMVVNVTWQVLSGIWPNGKLSQRPVLSPRSWHDF